MNVVLGVGWEGVQLVQTSGVMGTVGETRWAIKEASSKTRPASQHHWYIHTNTCSVTRLGGYARLLVSVHFPSLNT